MHGAWLAVAARLGTKDKSKSWSGTSGHSTSGAADAAAGAADAAAAGPLAILIGSFTDAAGAASH